MQYQGQIRGGNPETRQALARLLEATDLFAGLVQLSSGSQRQVKDAPEPDMLFIVAENLPALTQELALAAHPAREDAFLPLIVYSPENSQELWTIACKEGACEVISDATSHSELKLRLHSHLQLKSRFDRMVRERDQLKRQAITDHLTQLYNRRAFNLEMEREMARHNRNGKAFSVMLLDLDHFKQINDSYGHQAGDQVLAEVAKLLCKATRRSDRVCRYGGEEFAIIMPETGTLQAKLVATRICGALARLSHKGLPAERRVTTSIGICTAHDGQPGDWSLVVESADQALYAAKQAGRNCTMVGQSPRPAAPVAPLLPVASLAGCYA